MMRIQERFLSFVVVLLFLFGIMSLSFVAAVKPYGATVEPTNVSTAPLDDPDSEVAFAGNVTELVITGFTTTQSWQGYYGNVSGTIQLADSSDNVMYNWSLVSPRGEVYASTNSTILWDNLQCFNYTAEGTLADDTAQSGETSLYGTNLTQLESRFGINSSDDVDGVDETFNLMGPGTHDMFYAANLQFTEGECISTRIYDNSGTGVDNNFEEVLLYEPVTTSVIFTSLLERDLMGFNQRTNDFEMLVLEDGHGTDIVHTMYYFFVEIQ